MRGMLTTLRLAGWTVAVHNDYRQNGELWTFWLFTHPDGRWIKGEGLTDEDALLACMAATQAPSDPKDIYPEPSGRIGLPSVTVWGEQHAIPRKLRELADELGRVNGSPDPVTDYRHLGAWTDVAQRVLKLFDGKTRAPTIDEIVEVMRKTEP